jgi:hypothetical protein
MSGKWKLERKADKAAQFIVEVCVHSTYIYANSAVCGSMPTAPQTRPCLKVTYRSQQTPKGDSAPPPPILVHTGLGRGEGWGEATQCNPPRLLLVHTIVFDCLVTLSYRGTEHLQRWHRQFSAVKYRLYWLFAAWVEASWKNVNIWLFISRASDCEFSVSRSVHLV